MFSFRFVSFERFFFFFCVPRYEKIPQRSSTGTTGKSISKTRTSDNAFVTHTKTAQALKRRIFKLLGIEEYHESWADGLQVCLFVACLGMFMPTQENAFLCCTCTLRSVTVPCFIKICWINNVRCMFMPVVSRCTSAAQPHRIGLTATDCIILVAAVPHVARCCATTRARRTWFTSITSRAPRDTTSSPKGSVPTDSRRSVLVVLWINYPEHG